MARRADSRGPAVLSVAVRRRTLPHDLLVFVDLESLKARGRGCRGRAGAARARSRLPAVQRRTTCRGLSCRRPLRARRSRRTIGGRVTAKSPDTRCIETNRHREACTLLHPVFLRAKDARPRSYGPGPGRITNHIASGARGAILAPAPEAVTAERLWQGFRFRTSNPNDLMVAIKCRNERRIIRCPEAVLVEQYKTR